MTAVPMSNTALEKIKNEVAVENGFKDYQSTPTSFKPSLMGVVAERYASESVKEYKEKLDMDFIVYCLNQCWNFAHTELQKRDLGDIERRIYEQQKVKAKALIDSFD
jgi:hypothetical protein